MAGIRIASLAVVLSAAACYSEESTAPQYPRQVAAEPSWSGPPGGGMDPGYGYPQPEADGSYGASDGSYPPAADDPQGASEDPADPNYALGDVTDAEITATLDGSGEWVEDEDYGEVWVPYATVVGEDFTPYDSEGGWVYTDYGWSFDSDFAWGWLPFHYGNWFQYDDGAWGWAPGHHWGASWCEWRNGGGQVGWRPIAPGVRDHRSGGNRGTWTSTTGGAHIRDHRTHADPDKGWRFAAQNEMGLRNRPTHFAVSDGLRSTVPVVRPVPGRFGARASTLMTNRLRGGEWQRMHPIQPNRSFGQRGPAAGGRPWQGAGELGQSTAGGRAWQRPSQWNEPRPRTGAVQPTWNPTWQNNRRGYGSSGSWSPQPYRGGQRSVSPSTGSSPGQGYWGGGYRQPARQPTWGGSYSGGSGNNRAPQRTWVAPRPASPPSWGSSGGSRPTWSGGGNRAPSRPSFSGSSGSFSGGSRGSSWGGGGRSSSPSWGGGGRSSGGSSGGSRGSSGGSRGSSGGGGRHR